MANDAFQSGFNLRSKKKSGDSDGDKGKTTPGGTGGGLPGVIGKAVQKNRSQNKQATQTGGMPKMPDGIVADSFKHGGPVKKTGIAHLHKGEFVVPANQVQRIKKASRKKPSRTKVVTRVKL